jgi:hypothetical protein
MKARRRLFFDLEFTGLHQKTTPISLGIVSEEYPHKSFYAEFTDYDESQVNEFVRQHVLPQLYLEKGLEIVGQQEMNHVRVKGSANDIAFQLVNWITTFDGVEFWGDVPCYDWVLLCELLNKGGFPSRVFYIPFDIATLMSAKGIDPDINRALFIYGDLNTSIGLHNALVDAEIALRCFQKLVQL